MDFFWKIRKIRNATLIRRADLATMMSPKCTKKFPYYRKERGMGMSKCYLDVMDADDFTSWPVRVNRQLRLRVIALSGK